MENTQNKPQIIKETIRYDIWKHQWIASVVVRYPWSKNGTVTMREVRYSAVVLDSYRTHSGRYKAECMARRQAEDEHGI